MGARPENCIICDTKGVIWQGRTDGMNQWKSAHAVKTDLRTLEEAMRGADVFLGVSAKGAVTPEMVASMARDPVIFAMANPDPEITPEEAHAVRPDAIVATGRSDYPNQVNNVLGFPYLFRGALDIQARAINDEMKIACAEALAALAREDVPDEVAMAYGRKLAFGRDYIIPDALRPPPDPPHPARRGRGRDAHRRRAQPIADSEAYAAQLRQRMDPTASVLRGIHARARAAQATDDLRRRRRPPRAARRRELPARRLRPGARGRPRGATCTRSWASRAWPTPWASSRSSTPPTPRTSRPTRTSSTSACSARASTARTSTASPPATAMSSPSLMLAHGHGDGMVTGATRKSAHVMDLINHVFDAGPEYGAVGVTAVLHRGRIVLIADTLVQEWPEERDLALIARRGAQVARDLGLHPPRGLPVASPPSATRSPNGRPRCTWPRASSTRRAPISSTRAR